jgi:hypothetical protein
MNRLTGRVWTREQIELLHALINKRVSPARASVVLKRPKQAVQNKARELGNPFPDVRVVKAERLAREFGERRATDRAEPKSDGKLSRE